MITVVPMEMGVRIAGTVEFAGMNRPPNPRRIDALLQNGLATIPGLGGERMTTWMGHRPCTPDSLPVLGRAPRDPALLFAFGHGHQGLLGAAKTAQIIANLVADRPPSIDLRPFAVDRF
jgi:D-amino-acid dehydrogenase